MHNISRSQEVMNQNCHHGMVWVVVGRGFCFLSKDSCISTVIWHCWTGKTATHKVQCITIYDIPKPKIYRILSKNNQVIYTLDTIYHDNSSRASPDILFSSNSFRDTLLTSLKCTNLQRAISPENVNRICSRDNQVIYSSSFISWPSSKTLAQTEISCWQDSILIVSKGHNSSKGENSDKKQIQVSYFSWGIHVWNHLTLKCTARSA